MPGPRLARLALLVVLLPTAADCLSLAKGPSRRSPQPRLAKGAKPKKPKAFNLVCAGCSVECSGETSFIDHINGAAHRKRCGEQGLVGLLPNSDGVIPPLGPELSRAYDAYLSCGEAQQISCRSGAQASRVGMSIESRAQNFKADPAATELQFEPTLTKEVVCQRRYQPQPPSQPSPAPAAPRRLPALAALPASPASHSHTPCSGARARAQACEAAQARQQVARERRRGGALDHTNLTLTTDH